MSASIAQSLMNRGLSKPSLYQLEIPNNGKTAYFNANDYIKYYCKNVTLPEITHDVLLSNGHFRQGVVTQQAAGFKYNKPLVATIIERSDYFSYQEFHQWLMNTGVRINRDSGFQRLSYKDNYVADIKLRKLELPTMNKNGRMSNYENYRDMNDGFREVFDVTFVNAFITSLGTINYSSDAVDSMVEYEVEFYYDSYVINFNNRTREYQRNNDVRVDNVNPLDDPF
jgi:hypothetical protein